MRGGSTSGQARVLARHGRSLEGDDDAPGVLADEQPALASLYDASAADRQLLSRFAARWDEHRERIAGWHALAERTARPARGGPFSWFWQRQSRRDALA